MYHFNVFNRSRVEIAFTVVPGEQYRSSFIAFLNKGFIKKNGE